MPIMGADQMLIMGRRSSASLNCYHYRSKCQDEIKAIGNIRKSNSLTNEGCSNSCEDFDNDELTQVFGKEKKGPCCGFPHSKTQLLNII